MTETWTKNTYACDPDECDTLIEVTSSDKFGFPSGSIHNVKCPCGRTPNLLSVEPATIGPTIERKQMEETTTYDANVLVTYKKIENGEVSYPTIKVNELEWELDSYRRQTEKLNTLQSKVNQIIDNMTEDYWYNPNTDKETVLSDICEILGHTPKKTIRFSGRMTFEGELDIDLADAEDFDLEDHLSDVLTLDSYNGDVEIGNYSIDWVQED